MNWRKLKSMCRATLLEMQRSCGITPVTGVLQRMDTGFRECRGGMMGKRDKEEGINFTRAYG